MKYLTRVMLVCLFLASTVGTVFAANNNSAMGKRVPVASDMKKGKGISAGLTYMSVSKDLIKKTMKGKLTPDEARVIEKYIKGTKQNARDVKFLESALKKHSCFVPLNRKSKNLTMFPSAKSKPNWFTIDCSKKTSSKKKGGARGVSNNSAASSSSGNTTGAASGAGSAN